MQDDIYRDNVTLLDDDPNVRFFDTDDEEILDSPLDAPEDPEVKSDDKIETPKQEDTKEEDENLFDTDDDDEEVENEDEDEDVEDDKKPETKKARKASNKKKEEAQPDYNAIADILVEDGIFTQFKVDEEQELSPADIINGIEDEIKIGKEQWISEREAEINSITGGLIEFLDGGGSYDEWAQKTTPTTYENFDIETLTDNDLAAEQVLRTAYARRGYSKKKTEKLIQRSKDLEELVEDAKDEAQDLISNDQKSKAEYVERRKVQEKARAVEYKKAVDDVAKMVDDVEAFIPNLKATNKVKKNIKDHIFSRTVREKMTTDPLKYEVNLAVLDYYGLLDLDFDKIMETLETKATKNTKKQLIKTTSTKGNSSNRSNRKNANDIMKGFKGRSLVK